MKVFKILCDNIVQEYGDDAEIALYDSKENALKEIEAMKNSDEPYSDNYKVVEVELNPSFKTWVY